MTEIEALPDVHMGRIVAFLGRQVSQALADLDLSDSQYRLLAFVADGESAATALAGRLAVTRPSITALVDGLVARGYIERQTDESDRRRARLTLTASGVRGLAEADQVVSQRLYQVLDHLPATERARTEAATRSWGKALRAFGEARR